MKHRADGNKEERNKVNGNKEEGSKVNENKWEIEVFGLREMKKLKREIEKREK